MTDINRRIGWFRTLLPMSLAFAAVVAVGCATISEPQPEQAPVPEPSADVPAITATPELHVAAVGDIMLGGSAAPEMRKYGYDHPFANAHAWFQGAHIVFGNLEGPLTDRGKPVEDKQYIFRSPPDQVAPALAAAGFNVVSLANNHSLDYGVEGLEQTREALERHGIRYAGAGNNLEEARRPALLKQGDATVAFLAYSLTFPEEFWAGRHKPGSAFGHERHVRADVALAHAQADIVIVSFHWGRESTTELRDYQKVLGRAAIEAGASAVIGHHPHILQGVERYRDGVILYSLGNFAFGSYSRLATRGAVARLTFRANRLRRVRLIPIDVDNVDVVFQPRPLNGAEADAVVTKLQRLSRSRGTTLINRDGAAVLELPLRVGESATGREN